MEQRFVIRSRADSPELNRAAVAIEQAAWNRLGFLNYTSAHFNFYSQLLAEFPEYQLCLVDRLTGYPVAVGNTVPLACDIDDLPPEGWDWIVETAARPHRIRNALGALAISVPAIHRGKGLARQMIAAFRELAARKGLDGIIAPVRPSEKAAYPFIPIEEYVGWTDPSGRPFDPWLRSHLSAGGRIIGPCTRSMVVEEPIPFWENWSEQQFPHSGDYALPGALAPVAIDTERGVGLYEEPNVWFAYAN